jgi:hypothetical protein
MNSKESTSHHRLLRISIFSALAILWFAILLPFFKRPVYGPNASIFPKEGVMLVWERDTVVVKVDDREERVRRSDLATSPIYREALSRIPPSERPSLTQIRWRRLVFRWLAFTFITWWVVFRYWQPPRPYVEGGRASAA